MKLLLTFFIFIFLFSCGNDDLDFGTASDTTAETTEEVVSTVPTAESNDPSTNPDNDGSVGSGTIGGVDQIVSTPNPTPTPGADSSVETDSGTSSKIISWFLWKPASERDGKLVVLVNPEDVRVEVSGNVAETLKDFGPSNERGTTARSNRSGCDFGNNIRIDFFDSRGARVKLYDGRTHMTISRGCDRVEFRK